MQLIILISWLTITQSGILVLHREHNITQRPALDRPKNYLILPKPEHFQYRSIKQKNIFICLHFIPTFIVRISIKYCN